MRSAARRKANPLHSVSTEHSTEHSTAPAVPSAPVDVDAGKGGPAVQLGRLVRVGSGSESNWHIASWPDGAGLRSAVLHGTLDTAVAHTAAQSGEPVVFVTGAGGELVVVGALRTRGTPGIDAMESITLRASRIDLEGDAVSVRGRNVEVDAEEQIALRSKAAFVILRAASEIESFADRIVTRAEGVHKLVGRMLRLN